MLIYSWYKGEVYCWVENFGEKKNLSRGAKVFLVVAFKVFLFEQVIEETQGNIQRLTYIKNSPCSEVFTFAVKKLFMAPSGNPESVANLLGLMEFSSQNRKSFL